MTTGETRAGASGGRARAWAFRLSAVVLGPAIFFGLIELGLRLAGYGDPTSFFLERPRPGGGPVVTENLAFGRRFFPPGLVRDPLTIAFPKHKPVGTFRVFVLGESAALGVPDPTTSFARVLEVMLRERFPWVRFEVVNTAMVAINSNVNVPIARECARYRPDLFVVLMGNNEVVGPFGAAGVIGPFSPSLRLIRANLLLKSTRTGQLLGRVVRALGTAPRPAHYWGGMGMFRESRVAADDPRLRTTYDHFRENLGAICDAGTGAGAKVIVCTVPVNLADCAPFASLHSPGLSPLALVPWDRDFKAGKELEAAGKFAEAARRYDDAARVDDRYADLHFRLGRCLSALGRGEDARRRFVLARDLDALRFRADTAINEAVRRVAQGRSGRGVILNDAESDFASRGTDASPGNALFYEHVHMTFAGNYLLASAVFRKAADIVSSTCAVVAPPSEQVCADRLAYTARERFRNAARIHEMVRQPPFTDQSDHAEHEARWARFEEASGADLGPEALQAAADRCREAIRAAPDDWMLRAHHAQVLAEMNAPNLASAEYQAALKQVPHSHTILERLATVLLKAGRIDEAEEAYRAAVAASPGSSAARYGLAEVLAARGKVRDAVAAFDEQINKEPDRVEALRRAAAFLERVGRPTQARGRLEEALRIDPDDVPARVDLGNALARAGDLDGAIAAFESAIRLRPDWPELAGQLAVLRKSRADAPQALKGP